MSAYLEIKNGKVVYAGAKMELFIPNEYFKTNLAQEVGTGFKVFGYAKAYHYGNAEDDRSKAHKSVLAYPLMMITYPSKVEVEKIKFNNRPEDKYYVFTYYKDDVVFSTNEIVKDGGNVQTFFGMLMDGKLDMIEYRLIPEMLNRCKLWNSVKYGAPAMYEELIISDYYRNPNNHSEPARYCAVTAKEPFYALGITQRENVSNVSTFSGITYEDITAMLTKADNSKREGNDESVSQIEINSLEGRSQDVSL